LADERGNIQYREYLALESLRAEHEYPKIYSYRYYPSCSVYYDVNRKLYYYIEDDNWTISQSLSSNLERKLGDHVKIDMDNDKPYIDHHKHVKEFQPEDSKRTKNKLWSKLIFVLLYKHASK
jgi:hypothetical protein